MTEVKPFKGFIYNSDIVKIEDVVSPPYDIITEANKEVLYDRSINNIVRVDFGKIHPEDNETSNKYTRAGTLLEDWINNSIIKQSQKESYYLYETTYKVGAAQHIMRGIFGAVRLVELGDGVFPHEETHSKPKADRLNLMCACNANTSPIFSLYNLTNSISSKIIEKTSQSIPYLDYTDDEGLRHKCFIIDDKTDVETIKNELSGRDIFIADGHHRYETALEYSKMKELPNCECGRDYILMLLVNIADGGITILPTHRLIKTMPDNFIGLLSPYFEIKHIKDNSLNITQAISGLKHGFGLYINGLNGFYTLRYIGDALTNLPPELKDLDVTILHKLILGKLFKVIDFGYEMDELTTIKKVQEKEYKAAFFLNPTDVEDVERVSKVNLRMPPKSTYFYPKIPTGLVLNCFER
ncbi:MAG: DUF1015 domain-containing protein [Nitrospirae bacterium]|nr:DUF1015 domain-containing protein [Nitrospirota bacterium]